MSDDERDDPSIPDNAILWRRIPSWHTVPDRNQGGRMLSSAAFDDDNDAEPMSAFLASLVGEPHSVLEGHEGYALVGFTAGRARALGQRILRDEDDAVPGHVLVIGPKTHSVRKKLRAACVWVFRPPDWDDVALR